MSELLQLEPIGRRKSTNDAKASLFDFVNFNQRGNDNGSSAKKQRSDKGKGPRLSFTSKKRRAIYDDEEESSPELAQPLALPRKQKENTISSKSKDKNEGNAEKVTPRSKQTPRSRKKGRSTKRSLKSTNLKTPQSDKAEVNGENGNHNVLDQNTPSSPRKSNRLRRPTKIGFYYDEDDDDASTKDTSSTSPSPPVKLSKSENIASSIAVKLTGPTASPRKKSSRAAATTSVTANLIEVHEDDHDTSTKDTSASSPPAKVIKSSSRKVFCPRKKIASGGAARVTPRVTARVTANEIEVLEEVSADKRVNGSFQHVMPPESSPDKSGSGSECMEAMFVIEENGEDYRDLRNADLTKNMVLVPVEMTENVAGSMEPKFGTEHTNAEYPGVFRTTSHDLTETVGVGYLKIEARTIKPPEVCDDGKILYWIIKGTITVKSCGGYYQPNQRSVHNYLFGKALGPGACIVIPRKTVYTLENWGSQEAILSYCIISQSHP